MTYGPASDLLPGHRPSDCPEAIIHGPADGSGRCPWCRVKYRRSAPREYSRGYVFRSDLDDAYDRFWNPDWGTRKGDRDPVGYRRMWAL